MEAPRRRAGLTAERSVAAPGTVAAWPSPSRGRRSVALVTTVALVACAAHAGAVAADTVIDAGPVVTGGTGTGLAVASGRGWGVWARRDPSGAITLVAVRDRGVPAPLPLRPLRRLDGMDLGTGPDGAAQPWVYRGCRERCGYFRTPARHRRGNPGPAALRAPRLPARSASDRGPDVRPSHGAAALSPWGVHAPRWASTSAASGTARFVRHRERPPGNGADGWRRRGSRYRAPTGAPSRHARLSRPRRPVRRARHSSARMGCRDAVDGLDANVRGMARTPR